MFAVMRRSSSTGASTKRVLAVVGLILLAVITLNIKSATRIFTWPWWPVWRLTLLIPVAWCLVSAWRPGAHGLTRGAGWLAGGFVGLYVVAAATSAHPAASLSYAVSMLALLALAWAVAQSPAAVRWVPPILAAGSVIYCAASIAAWWWLLVLPSAREFAALNAAAGAPLFIATMPRNSLLLGHWNYTAGMGVIALPWALAYAWRSAGWRRVPWILSAGIVVFTLITAMSRGAWIGVAAAAGFAVVTAVAWLRWPWRRIGLVAVAALVVAVVATLLMPRIRATAIAFVTGRGFTESDVQRLNMTAVGVAIVRDHPGLGQGPGLTPRLYPAYRRQVDGGVETAFQLHSTPLQLAADAGLVASLLAGALVGCALLRGLLGMRQGRTVPWECAVTGIALAGYVVYALTDYQLDVPVIAAAVGAMLGLLLQDDANADGSGVATSRIHGGNRFGREWFGSRSRKAVPGSGWPKAWRRPNVRVRLACLMKRP